MRTLLTQAMIRNIEADGTRSGHLHLRNNIRCGDDHVIPLQFVYDAADCRTFYKIDSMLSRNEARKAACSAHWGQ